MVDLPTWSTFTKWEVTKWEDLPFIMLLTLGEKALYTPLYMDRVNINGKTMLK